MPAEVLLYILRWVVSGDLDMRSLDRCALVSRGFYIYARDPEIWRLACQRVWGATEAHISRPAFASWRHMYTQKARVHLNGVYVSKTSYFRYGENSFQDQFYRPMHQIVYYRYVRFFADGHAYMLTTPDAIGTTMPRLIVTPRQQHRADLLYGTYSIDAGGSGTVRLQLRRQRTTVADAAAGGRRRRASRAANTATAYDADRNLTYDVMFRIRTIPTHRPDALATEAAAEHDDALEVQRDNGLVWCSYATYRDDINNKTDQQRTLHNEFELKKSLYPALLFQRVPEFHSVAIEPLM